MKPSTPLMVALALVTATVLTGCGAGTVTEEHSPSSAAPSSAPAEPSAAHNDADVTFVQQMIPHHQQAVAMAKLAPSRAAASAVKELAARIQSAQQPQIDQMTRMLTSWHVPADPGQGMSDMPGMSSSEKPDRPGDPDMGGHGMAGMMSAQQMAQLQGASGASFDKQFLTMMIDHHQGAVQMSATELRDGSSASAKALAHAISDAQTAEINQMRTMLATG